MVFQISAREGDSEEMKQFNHGQCSGGCATYLQPFKMGNLTIESPDKVYPPSEPVYDDYVWEEKPWETHMCPDLDTDDCKYSWRCIQCAKSYPVGDPDKFDSKDAKCRCHDWTPYPFPLEEKTYCPFYD